MHAPTGGFSTPADSALTLGGVYSVSLLATVPLLLAVVAFLFLQQASAGTRAIVWRCTLVSLFAIYVGRFVPWQWMAWVLPEALARPLVALGTVQVDAPPGMVGNVATGSGSSLMRGLQLLYWSGVAFILVRTLVARLRLMLIGRRGTTLSSPAWRKRLTDAGIATGVSVDSIRLLASTDAQVPATWGVRRPVVLLPRDALRWPADRVQAVLRHELTHIGAHDPATRLLSRILCALFWFHPGVWWLARRFDNDAEAACDDRVLLSGVRASDYAEWLAASAHRDGSRLMGATALARRGNLRARLAAVTDTQRRVVTPTRKMALCTVALASIIAVPLATVRLAPTRQVLTSLMQEARWESRAWAVVRLAQRADSVDVARSAARHDPDPTVRAWARYALGLTPIAPASRSGS